MVADNIYELCLPILKDPNVEDEDKTEKLQELVEQESSLTGKALEEAVLGVLWRFRESTTPVKASPPIRHNILRRHSPALGQLPRSPLPRSPLASPSLSGVPPAVPSGLSGRPQTFQRATSYHTSSPFGSPRASPRLAFAGPIPHSPSLSSYEFSEPSLTQNDYGDYGSDTVDWLVNEELQSRPTSSGAGSAYESGLSGAATSWIQPQQNEMSPYDMLRSVLGDGKTDEEIESALEANSYDLSTTLMNLMGAQAMYQDPNYMQPQEGQILIGKSLMPSQTIAIDRPASRGRSPIVCKYWLSNGNCLRADCRFSHDLSNHICKYWVMGNCLAGDSCIFSHDPALLLDRINIGGGDAAMGTSSGQLQPSFQVQDYDAFPALQQQANAQWAQSPSSPSAMNISKYSGSQVSNGYFPPMRQSFEARKTPLNGLSSSPASSNSRPTSRHQSRVPTPSIPAVDDNDAFPTLGAAGTKGPKKHHGKRGGHGHGHGHSNKENAPGSLADLVRMSPAPASSPLRKGLTKRGSYQNSRENSLAANAIPAPQHVPWLETGEKTNQAYLKARQDAFKHGGLRNKFLQSAAQAWNRNDARAAKALSLRGQSENELMRKAHREAARVLYEERNKDSSASSEIYVDLHGLHPDEALEYLEAVLMEQAKSSRPVYAITGTGHHSKGGKDKVGKAVRGWLNEWKYAWREFSVPGDSMGAGGVLGIDPKSFDKSLVVDERGKSEESQQGVVGEEVLGGKIKVVKEAPLSSSNHG